MISKLLERVIVEPNQTVRTLGLTAILTAIASVVFGSLSVFADDIVDQITVTVPLSCNMSGLGQGSHTANVNNGTTNSAIGSTTAPTAPTKFVIQ